MSKTTDDHPTASDPTGVTPSTTTTTATATPTKTTTTTTTTIPEISTFLQPTPIPALGMHRGIFRRREDLDISGHSPTPAMPQPGAVPFPKETGTSPSSRCSSVNPNDTLPPTPTPGAQPQPYPPQMRMPILSTRDNPKPTILPPGDTHQPTTQPPLENRYADSERTATTNMSVLPATPTDNHNPFLSRPLQGASYTAARRSGESHPSGYRQDSGAMEKPRYDGREEEGGEETLLGKLGKWIEGVNSKIVETGITGDVKGKGKGKGKQ